jgi:hypothetical protein
LLADPIDREVVEMIGKGISTAKKLFTFVRYNTELSREGLDSLENLRNQSAGEALALRKKKHET